MKNLRIKVFGKVQGVWYRKSTKDKADELGLTGFVMNNPDKTVTIEVKGEENVINELIKWAKDGPLLAKVSKIEIEDILKEYPKGFNIKR